MGKTLFDEGPARPLAATEFGDMRKWGCRISPNRPLAEFSENAEMAIGAWPFVICDDMYDVSPFSQKDEATEKYLVSPRKTLLLTGRELEALKTLWEQVEPTVREASAAMNFIGEEPAFTTLLSPIPLLEQEASVDHSFPAP